MGIFIGKLSFLIKNKLVGESKSHLFSVSEKTVALSELDKGIVYYIDGFN